MRQSNQKTESPREEAKNARDQAEANRRRERDQKREDAKKQRKEKKEIKTNRTADQTPSSANQSEDNDAILRDKIFEPFLNQDQDQDQDASKNSRTAFHSKKLQPQGCFAGFTRLFTCCYKDTDDSTEDEHKPILRFQQT